MFLDKLNEKKEDIKHDKTCNNIEVKTHAGQEVTIVLVAKCQEKEKLPSCNCDGTAFFQGAGFQTNSLSKMTEEVGLEKFWHHQNASAKKLLSVQVWLKKTSAQNLLWIDITDIEVIENQDYPINCKNTEQTLMGQPLFVVACSRNVAVMQTAMRSSMQLMSSFG